MAVGIKPGKQSHYNYKLQDKKQDKRQINCDLHDRSFPRNENSVEEGIPLKAQTQTGKRKETFFLCCMLQKQKGVCRLK
jgi:hypothetical protein